MEQPHGDYLISDETDRLQPTVIHGYLARSYWSANIPRDVVERALENSVCVGAYASDGTQVGLVRVITDFATFAYLCDVFVLETHRNRGLSKAMLALAMQHPRLQGLRSWNLRTRDAHGLYAQFGFKPIDNPQGYMVLRFPDVYASPQPTTPA